ncbi:MAG: beta strand repeat-containing protein, partial [Microcoleus sp.]
ADRAIDILTLNATGGLSLPPQFQSGGNLSLISNGVISGDSHFASRGNFSVRNLSGMPGNFVSLFDPIISSERDVFLGDYTGVSLKVEAKGSIVAESITITGPDLALRTENLNPDDPDIVILTTSPALILRAGLRDLANPLNISTDSLGDDGAFSSVSVFPRGFIYVENNIFAGGPVIASAPGDVVTREINGGSITLTSTAGAVIVGGRLISGSTIDIEAANNILTSDISRGGINGNITLTSGGNIVTRAIDSGTNGAIALTAAGNVNFGNLQGSQVNVTSSSGALGVLNEPNTIVPNTTPVNITATENLTLAASGDLTVGNLAGATVRASSRNGSVATGTITSTGDVRILARQQISTAPITVNPTAANPLNPTIPIVNLDAQTNINVASVNAPTATIALRATNNLNAGNLQGGAIDISSTTGNITTANAASTGNINVRAAGNVNSGNLQGSVVDLVSSRGNVSTGNINASSIVDILAGGQIGTGAINVNLVVRDRNPAVNINAQNDISIVSVNAPGAQVDIATPGLVRVTGTFDQNGTPVSVSTLGRVQPGTVRIAHGGGDVNPPIPFSVGDATTNG